MNHVSVRDLALGRAGDRARLREEIGDARNYLVLLEALLLDEQERKDAQ